MANHMGENLSVGINARKKETRISSLLFYYLHINMNPSFSSL